MKSIADSIRFTAALAFSIAILYAWNSWKLPHWWAITLVSIALSRTLP